MFWVISFIFLTEAIFFLLYYLKYFDGMYKTVIQIYSRKKVVKCSVFLTILLKQKN